MLVETLHFFSHFHQMLVHTFRFHFQVENTLQMLTVGQRVVSLLDFALIGLNLFLHVFKVIFSVL